MKRFYHSIFSCVCVLVWCASGISLADSVTQDSTIYSRQNADSVDEDELLTVHFIDVGSGDAILINTPSDKKILIDGGWSWGDRGKAPREYLSYLDRFLGDDVVDLIIITHPDYDHFAGLHYVLDSYSVRQIWYTGYDSNDLSTSWNNLVDKIQEEEGLLYVSPIEDFLGLGSIIRFDNSETYKESDDVVLTIINARRWLSDEAYGSRRYIGEARRRNSSSLVVKLDFGNTSFLFTGDTNGRKKWSDNEGECEDQERFMVDNNKNPDNPLYGELNSTVLKVAHHGSDGSSSLPFLKAVKPEWAIISAGVHHDHPHSPVLERLSHQDVGLDDSLILRTDMDEDTHTSATEANLGDDSYQFFVDPDGIVKIEKWNVRVED